MTIAMPLETVRTEHSATSNGQKRFEHEFPANNLASETEGGTDAHPGSPDDRSWAQG